MQVYMFIALRIAKWLLVIPGSFDSIYRTDCSTKH